MTDTARTVTTVELHGPRHGDEPLELEQITHDDWEPGKSCPYCETTYIRETHVQGELAYHNCGGSEFKQAMDRLATVEYVCDECEKTLYRHPVASLLMYHGEDFEP